MLGGGTAVQLYAPTDLFVGLGAANYSMPSPNDNREWTSWVTQPSVGGATKATVTIRAVCATAS